MITNHDRSGWFGASDTVRVMGRWDTQTFARWWAVKLGLLQSNFTTREMAAGTAYEHKILAAIGVTRTDRTIYRPLLRLRVNLDGESAGTIHEVKTHGKDAFCMTVPYWQQCQVQMYVSGKACEIVAYRLLEEDYDNYFNPIDKARISRHPVAYDTRWVREEYLPRLRYLARCLRRKETPHEFTG